MERDTKAVQIKRFSQSHLTKCLSREQRARDAYIVVVAAFVIVVTVFVVVATSICIAWSVMQIEYLANCCN